MPILASEASQCKHNSSDKMLPPVGIEPGPLIASDSKSNTILLLRRSLNFCSCSTWYLDLDDLRGINRLWLYKKPKVSVLQANVKLERIVLDLESEAMKTFSVWKLRLKSTIAEINSVQLIRHNNICHFTKVTCCEYQKKFIGWFYRASSSAHLETSASRSRCSSNSKTTDHKLFWTVQQVIHTPFTTMQHLPAFV